MKGMWNKGAVKTNFLTIDGFVLFKTMRVRFSFLTQTICFTTEAKDLREN